LTIGTRRNARVPPIAPFRDPELRKAMSAEAVEGTVAQQGGMTGAAAP
jgi:hypothetical protein